MTLETIIKNGKTAIPPEKRAPAPEDLEHRRKFIMANLLSLIGIGTAIPLGLLAFGHGHSILGLVDQAVALLLTGNLLLLRKTRNVSRAGVVGMAVVTPFYFYLFYTGGVQGTAALWYFTFPLLATFLLGSTPGLRLSLGLILASLLLILGGEAFPGLYPYPVSFTLRFFPSLLVVLLFAYVFESGREKTHHSLLEQTGALLRTNRELKQEVEERKKAEAGQKASREAAEVANRAKSDFLANMSHELRTPLNHIMGFTELVLEPSIGELNQTQKEFLKDVNDSGRHLLSLINDILDLAKVEAGKMKLDLADVPLRRVLEKSLVMIKEKALKRGIQTSLECEETPETIRADERKLKQMLYNLLSNAVKFTPDGGAIAIKTRQVPGSALREKGWAGDRMRAAVGDRETFVLVSVSDTGAGLAPADLQRIFHPFEQGGNTAGREKSGTGLGLALTREMAELHGGLIRAESGGLGQGATFSIALPVAVDHPARPAE